MSDTGQSSRRQFILGSAAIFGGAVLLPGCGGGGGGGNTIAPPQASLTRGVLGGGQQVPPVTSPGKGIAEIAINSAQTQMTVTLNTSGLTNVVMAHIHAGKVGVSGPIILDLFTGAQGTFPATLTKTLTANDLQSRPTAGINTFQDAVNAVLAGNAYVNVHTAANPGGEIRGQLGQITTNGVLTGTTNAYGSVTGSLEPTLSSMTLTLQQVGLTGVTGAEIRIGREGDNGPVAFTLATADFNGQLSAVLNTANLIPQTTVGVSTFADFVDALLSGKVYVAVKTTGNANGALRGQLLFTNYAALLTANGAAPSVTNVAHGRADVSLNLTKDVLAINVATDSTVTGVTGVFLGQPQPGSGLGAPGTSPYATLYNSTTDGTYSKGVSKLLRTTDLTPSGGVSTIADVLALIASGRAFVYVSTASAGISGPLLG